MRRLLIWTTATALVVATVAGVVGYVLFTRPHGDVLGKADAIVVLGGDQDGRIDYGLQLARQGYADTVVIADSYPADYPVIRRACASSTARIEVVCFVPDPWSTLGEAMFASRMARERGWQHLIVVSWNFHMVRARYIFEKCFDGELTMRPTPRDYDYDIFYWGYVYAYQYAALLKAATLPC
ncbi:hypothetical protein BVC93_02880 [Mycobacterium sp. MS1601]|uniref:YdcF family protein n=1 Tax=Mycobacterium sp. MS1601 TaxID=1936029 RepID=UPI0009797427|nr:YdcF family protein [Mycobacterium sp. MS1601]AQA01548.1 hypothetical protein BVC93_02880 [Mycobacterium sp. MS1601]